MKQFFCIIVTLAASAALLWLVSAPVDNLHGAESGSDTHSEETVGGHTESVPAAICPLTEPALALRVKRKF